MLGESLEKTEANLIVELEDVQSGVSMTSSKSTRSYGIYYLCESTVDLHKVLYKLHMEDDGYFWIAQIILKMARILRHWSEKLHQSTRIWMIFQVFLMHTTRSSLQDVPT